MPTTSKVTTFDYDKLTSAEKQFVDLYGLAALQAGIANAESPAAPPARSADKPAAAFTIIGKEQRDLEGYKIVTGRARFTADIYFPDMLYVRVKRSPLPHARVKSIDTSKAEKLPGVKAVMTYKDIPEKMTAGGRPILASEPGLVGDPIAAVAAINETIAEDALNLIDVQYDQLPFVIDAREAEKPNAPLALSTLKNNLAGTPFKATRGDVSKGFADADLVVEHVVDTQDQQHVAMEPHMAVAKWDRDNLTIWITSQYTHSTAASVAASFGLPTSRVRVISEFTGGGFGDKAGIAFPYIWLVTLLSRKTGRPVRYELTRTDVFMEATHHYPVYQTIKLGFKKDGTLTAIQARSIAQAGAYSPFAGFLASDTLSAARVQYTCANISLEGVGVITNTGVAGARRAVGEPSGVFALELLMDEAAEKLSMDPVELRLKNLNETGDPESKQPWSSNGLRESIVKGAEAFKWKERWKGWNAVNSGTGPVKRGVGFMALASNKGSKGPPMTAVVEIPVDGSVRVVQGGAHIGGSQRTTWAMIVAEALSVKLEQVSVTPPDTAFTSDTGVVAGSRATKSIGLAVKTAAEDARQQLLVNAASKWSKDLKKDVKADELEINEGLISYKPDASVKPLTFAQAVASGFVIVDGQLEVNTETGVVRVLDVLQAHDVGRVINLLTIRSQVEGGSMQGIGFALTEDYIYDKATGIPVSANLDDYKMLMINNTPKITSLFIETNDAVGPFGAKGIGEPALMPPAAGIANAIYHAAGIRLKSLPMNPKKVMEALKKKA
ncbi:MAG: xanthine dehydrogenase family protein molybdopterin-binding subunit [Chloroflexi bacterium]|nr:xanthine dehydrogenase family protein molybdopterin-binding subunit [Chloroflexota bacterium]